MSKRAVLSIPVLIPMPIPILDIENEDGRGIPEESEVEEDEPVMLGLVPMLHGRGVERSGSR
jgi:hypothetical protein